MGWFCVAMVRIVSLKKCVSYSKIVKQMNVFQTRGKLGIENVWNVRDFLL